MRRLTRNIKCHHQGDVYQTPKNKRCKKKENERKIRPADGANGREQSLEVEGDGRGKGMSLRTLMLM